MTSFEPSSLCRLMTLSDHALIAHVGRDGTVWHLSPGLRRVLGPAAEAPTLAGWFELAPDGVRALEEGASEWRGVGQLRRVGASPWDVSVVAVAEQDGLLLLIEVAFDAMAEQLQAEHEAAEAAFAEVSALNDEREQLEGLAAMKQQFVSVVSHELNTPLSLVLGFGSLLHDGSMGPLSQPQHEAVGQVLKAAQRLETLIGDLLDANKLQTGNLELRPSPVALPSLLETVFEQVAESFQAAQLTLERPADPPPVVWADARRLHQVLRQLLANAAKFTPAGGHVRLTIEPSVHEVRFALRDTGIGIPLEAQARLFEPFYQVDATTTRAYGGTGIGLWLVRALIEAMHGRMWVESVPGAGSTFGFSLPARRPSAAEGEEVLHQVVHGGAGVGEAGLFAAGAGLEALRARDGGR